MSEKLSHQNSRFKFKILRGREWERPSELSLLKESKNTQHINNLAKLAIWLKRLKPWNNSSCRLCAFMLSTDGFTFVNFSSYFMLFLRWEVEGWHFLSIFTGKSWAEIITSVICLVTVQWGKMNDDGPWHLYFALERKRVCLGREKRYLIKIKSYWIGIVHMCG